MKKYFVLALVLAAFVVAPVMADVTLSGAFRIGALWDISEGNYLARLDRTRLYINSNIDDFSKFVMEYRGSRHRELGTNYKSSTRSTTITTSSSTTASGTISGDILDGTNTSVLGPGEHFVGTFTGKSSSVSNVGSPYRWLGGRAAGGNTNARGEFGYGDFPWVEIYLHRAIVTTDWAKYFGFADVVGVKSEVGYDAFGAFNKLDYMIFGAGSQGLLIQRDMGAKVSFDIMGIVKPYFAKAFYAYDNAKTENNASYIVGTGIDFAPIWVEAYFIQDGDPKTSRAFVGEAEFSQKIDDMKLKVGAIVDMRNGANDEWENMLYKVLAGFNAFGADLGLGFMGYNTKDENYMGQLAVSVKYGVTKFLDIQAGGKFAFGEYSKTIAGDQSWLGAEFGAVVKPGKVSYSLGYAILNDKSNGTYVTDSWGLGGFGIDGNGAADSAPWAGSPYVNNWKGALMFRVNTSF